MTNSLMKLKQLKLNTVHSARPSSRSSLRSSNSIGSYTNRRPSSAPQSGSKGILVSTSRSGAARSAAILLISCHISALNKTNGSDDNMTKHLQKQLKQQKQLLHLELPAVNSKGLMRKLGLNGIENHDDEEFNSLDNGCCELGAVPTPASDVPKVAVKLDLFLGFCYFDVNLVYLSIILVLNFDFLYLFILVYKNKTEIRTKESDFAFIYVLPQR